MLGFLFVVWFIGLFGCVSFFFPSDQYPDRPYSYFLSALWPIGLLLAIIIGAFWYTRFLIRWLNGSKDY